MILVVFKGCKKLKQKFNGKITNVIIMLMVIMLVFGSGSVFLGFRNTLTYLLCNILQMI